MKVFLFPLLSFLFSSFVFAKNSNFASQTIDLGLVVSDIEKSLKFYKQVVGFEEKEGFEVGGKFEVSWVNGWCKPQYSCFDLRK